MPNAPTTQVKEVTEQVRLYKDSLEVIDAWRKREHRSRKDQVAHMIDICREVLTLTKDVDNLAVVREKLANYKVKLKTSP